MSLPQFEGLALSLATNGLLTIQFKRPPVNALSSKLLQEVHHCFTWSGQSPNVQAILLKSAQKAFCAGLDLTEVSTLTTPEKMKQFIYNDLELAFASAIRCPKPVSCVVSGHAIAGGLIIALAADHLVFEKGNYKLGLTEHRVGVPFPSLALRIVERQCPVRISRQLSLTADLYGPQQLYEAGVGDALVEPGQAEQESLKWLNQIAFSGRPLGAFKIWKANWWKEVTSTVPTNIQNPAEVDQYLKEILDPKCHQAIVNALKA
eukprot:TRINITY_DN5320_c0_g1_i1.p1 TRINITY_DN5320_c0_g1~~TRINITY_DN5320_c0_g1_i1.p1  ORF type:complete len:270 (-),score=86.19 TRINITY_DN5320_c0_g1_i1:40-825(-)